MGLNLDIKAACEKDFSLRKEFERRSPNTKYSYADMREFVNTVVQNLGKLLSRRRKVDAS